jgi:hypothetical protein
MSTFENLVSHLAKTPLLADVLNEKPSLTRSLYYEIIRTAKLDDILASGNSDVYSLVIRRDRELDESKL